MKIVIFGLTISSSWGNGHATLWRGLLKALTARGHYPVFFERDVSYYADQRDMDSLPGGKLVLYNDWTADVETLAREELSDADVGMVTSYCPDALPATALLMESGAKHRVFYDLDAPVTLSQLLQGQPVPYIGERKLQDFDLVLSYTGGQALDLLQSELGAQRVAPLYGSVDPDAHYPVVPQPVYTCDLSYLGTYAADRQQALEDLFITPARHRPHQQFLIGGAQYPTDFPWTPNINFVRHLPPGEHPAFFSSSRLTLNITRAAMAQMGYCPSGRLFEAAACGTAMISDWWTGLDEFFEPGTELIVCRNTHHALAAIDLSSDDTARIGAAARQRALTSHTAAHRAMDFEAAIAALAATPHLAEVKS